MPMNYKPSWIERGTKMIIMMMMMMVSCLMRRQKHMIIESVDPHIKWWEDKNPPWDKLNQKFRRILYKFRKRRRWITLFSTQFFTYSALARNCSKNLLRIRRYVCQSVTYSIALLTWSTGPTTIIDAMNALIRSSIWFWQRFSIQNGTIPLRTPQRQKMRRSSWNLEMSCKACSLF